MQWFVLFEGSRVPDFGYRGMSDLTRARCVLFLQVLPVAYSFAVVVYFAPVSLVYYYCAARLIWFALLMCSSFGRED